MVLKLPRELCINDTAYKIRSDFRVVLTVLEMLEDDAVSRFLKPKILLEMLFYDATAIPADYVAQAYEMACNFVDGTDIGITGSSKSGASTGRLYLWSKDQPYILGAVDKQLGFCALERDYLHWWVWLQAFVNIGDCTFAHIIRIRKAHKSGKLTKDERKMYNDNPDLYSLETTQSIHTKLDILAQINNMKRG